ncbi:hypothetical protein ROJ8625_02262 [Roseivivax jejudonensis]|uniref:FG-GAP repeat protein n=1 Tax=Roseivivax jejudonensis TaxID=1529041 RepID=A0A1X6ZBC9_9RHOB|nr:hypothetical protein [Roseivivax jejudonensis]SLN46747.1 hypothetical protein ROJ8625_02262 [Roseivivax jejudonensis]
MRVIAGLLAAVVICADPPGASAQSSNAARYLLEQELSAACTGIDGRARLDGGLVERDLDGDGRQDLLISHEGIVCGQTRRSGFCGAQVCSVKIWLRRGDLLELETEFLGGGITVGTGARPTISGFGQGGKGWTTRWDGTAFR